MTTDLILNRSEKYLQLLKDLKEWGHNGVDIGMMIYEQGKKDGLPNDIIRRDIELALEGVVKERQLRNILPLELKRKYSIESESNSAIIAECDTPGWEYVVEGEEFRVVDVSSLKPSPFVVREQDLGSMINEEFGIFCESIKGDGLLNPMIVRQVSETEEYEVVIGTRRLLALKTLGIKTTPVIIRKLTDFEVRIWSLNSNIHFLPLTEREIKNSLQKIHDERFKQRITRLLEIRQKSDISKEDNLMIE